MSKTKVISSGIGKQRGPSGEASACGNLEEWTNNNTVLACLAAYFAFVVTRVLALKTVELVVESIYLVAASPLQAILLLMAASIVATYALDRQGRAAQSASALGYRILSALVVPHYVKGAIWSLSERDALRWQAERQHPQTPNSPSPPSSLAGSECSSSGKEISSFRIPDRSLRSRDRAPALRRRHSAPANPSRRVTTVKGEGSRSRGGGGGGGGLLAERDVGGLTSPRTPDSSRLRSSRRSWQGSRDASLSPRASRDVQGSASGGASVGSRRTSWQPRMHRITSGMELNTGALGNAGPTTSAHDLHMPPTPARSENSGVEEPVSPTATWATSASSSLSSLTSKVDSLLRPLVPAPPALESLRRWPSAPLAWRLPWQGAGQEDVDATSGGGGGGGGRRGSLDGIHAAARHYTSGGIAARPSRRDALERFACAARLQACSSPGGAPAPAQPGHVSIGSSSLGAADASTSTSPFASFAGRAAHSNGQQPALDINTSPGTSALASVGLDGDCPQSIREVVTDEHLLQLGALLGESASESALRTLGLPGAFDDDGALYGRSDDGTTQASWELVIDEGKPGLSLQAWRMPLRGGLYVYRSKVLIEGIAPRDVRPFHLDDQARSLWDDGAVSVQRMPAVDAPRPSRHAESCLHRYVSRFPRPMAPREYDYARRVWHRPYDGGCYTISRNVDLPDDPSAPKAVKVLEFTSCSVIRAAPGGTEVASLYYEDSQVRPGLAKMAVPKGLWPFWTKYQSALKMFADARSVAVGGAGKAGGHRSLDGRSHHVADADACDSGSGSDDELYGALAELKARKKRRGGGLPGKLGSSSRWARRLIIAGAFRMMHLMLAAEGR